MLLLREQKFIVRITIFVGAVLFLREPIAAVVARFFLILSNCNNISELASVQ
jgi:hypothetical protein